jgi:hypothetical protein
MLKPIASHFGAVLAKAKPEAPISMSESKHTPGPWAAKANAYGCWFVYGGGAIPSPLVCGGNSHDTLTEANARLIAAAPAMHTALTRLERAYAALLHTGYERILALGGDCDTPEIMERGDSALIEARAALSLAEGKEAAQ